MFAGCMASGLEDMLENADIMASAGADVAVLTAPGYFRYSQTEIEAIFLKFADSSQLPVMIYDIPAFTGTHLDLEMILRLSEHPKVIGFKDSSGDMDTFRSLAKALSGCKDFYLLQGKEHLLLDSLRAGASGFVVSLVHMDPRPFVELLRVARVGSAQRAEAFQARITSLMNWVVSCFKRRPETSTLFHVLNAALCARGVCKNILLEHEGDTPPWLREETQTALRNLQLEHGT